VRRLVISALYAATLAVFGVGLWYGREYYSLPIGERLRHPLHWTLKPGGEIGLLYGIVGAALMAIMLVYSLRRRVGALRKAGRLSTWLDFHIWCGVTGPLLIVLHSSFRVGTLVAIAFWSMVAVATSGVLGRFLYAQIPRTAAGVELSLDEATRLEVRLGDRLRDELGVPSEALVALEDPVPPRDASIVRAFVALLGAPGRIRRRVRALVRRHGVPRANVRALQRVAVQRALLHHRLAVWRRVHELFHYWHVVHRPFTVLLYIFLAVHIAVAWMTGYAGGPG